MITQRCFSLFRSEAKQVASAVVSAPIPTRVTSTLQLCSSDTQLQAEGSPHDQGLECLEFDGLGVSVAIPRGWAVLSDSAAWEYDDWKDSVMQGHRSAFTGALLRPSDSTWQNLPHIIIAFDTSADAREPYDAKEFAAMTSSIEATLSRLVDSPIEFTRPVFDAESQTLFLSARTSPGGLPNDSFSAIRRIPQGGISFSFVGVTGARGHDRARIIGDLLRGLRVEGLSQISPISK
jgi:hypothetical protein